jgi:diaminopimelate epimerase
MHGCGNDYVVVDGFRHEIDDPAALARRMTDRRTGVGADGLLLALPGDEVPLRMRMFNVDGTEAEMCGNGLRCLVKYALERGLVPWQASGRVETGAGALAYEVVSDEADGVRTVREVTVWMGVPRLERAEIPMRGPEGRVIDEPLTVGDGTLRVTAVSMGNPHAVIWVDAVRDAPVVDVGPLVEHHDVFPSRTNTEFVEVVSRTEVRQRTWERGCGETLACGTGACAVAVAGVLADRTEREILIHLEGGDLNVAWESEEAGGQVRMRGPAVEVFDGTWLGAE